jgi:hypothetical protein
MRAFLHAYFLIPLIMCALCQIPTLDVLTVKQMLTSLERKINRNLELRMKFPGEPAKYAAVFLCLRVCSSYGRVAASAAQVRMFAWRVDLCKRWVRNLPYLAAVTTVCT